MQMNPRPAKSLNQRPAKQLGSLPNTQGTPAVSTAQPLQGAQSTVAPRQLVPPTKGVSAPPEDNKSAFLGQKAAVTSNATVVADTGSVNPLAVFVVQMKNMVSAFAILSDDVISENLKMALGGFSAEDRTMPYEVADYLMSNMGFIFMGLVLDENFKNSFKESLKIELNIDKQADNIKEATRKKMGNPKKYESRGAMVIGTSDFLPEVKAALSKKMQDSFNQLDGFAEEFDSEIKNLTRTQKLEYGFIFSNFMYLARAFTHNDMFMSYVISVIEKVKAITVNAK